MKRVGILTFQNALNYGALLQAYALQEKCRELGYDTKIINYRNPAFYNAYFDVYHMEHIIYENLYDFTEGRGTVYRVRTMLENLLHHDRMQIARNKIERMSAFIKNYFRLSKEYTPGEIKNANEEFDTFIVGSDQVWNMSSCRFDLSYYLNFTDKEKISYAASIGKEWITGFEYDHMKQYLPSYRKISVREGKAKEIIQERIGIESSVVLDPTLLHDRVFWSKIADTSSLKREKEYVLIYALHKQTNLVAFAEKLAKEEGLELISLSELPFTMEHKTVLDASIEDFLYLMKNAKYVLVTSFHGLAFSINFNQDFYYELEKTIPNNNSRLVDLCTKLSLSDREIVENMERKAPIDWEKVNEKLNEERKASVQFLADALGV